MVPQVLKVICKDALDVKTKVREHISLIAADSISKRGLFTLGLSGGSMAEIVKGALPEITTDWKKWKLFFCDERLVPVESSDSTHNLYLPIFESTPLTCDQLATVNTSLDVKAAAEDYEKKVRSVFPDVEWPEFDLLLLGMGPDGHTASLFPEHALLKEERVWVAPIDDSPKPPPCRVTMTFPVINNSRNCLFAILGKGKAEMVKRVLKNDEDLPVNRVKPQNGKVLWILDEDAGELL